MQGENIGHARNNDSNSLKSSNLKNDILINLKLKTAGSDDI